ncbi:S8 family serine peptidase [Longispora sp. NPDC051575]|uniref:S8 family serine peptidase n=1 Tax=Longispora sp. NPDC051575 TaxID=3154943 RepID=UPI003425D2C3
MTVLAAGVVLVAAPGVAHADTVRGLSWHLDSLKIGQAHAISQGEGVVVAVIDSGVDAGHPDLQGQVLPGFGIGGDAAADGRADVVGHGTRMAGLIVGKGGGDQHVLGVAPRAKILPVSLGSSYPGGEIADAIRGAVDRGASVINVSLGGGTAAATSEETAAVAYAISKDVVVVAAAGNLEQGARAVASPARIPGVVAVAASSQDGSAWSGSVQGAELAVAAPGVRIVSTDPQTVTRSGYAVSDGTSGAAAIVSGEAALIRSKFKQLSAANVINRIIRTAKDAGNPGRDDLYGFGVIDPVAALTADVPEVSSNPLIAGGTGASPVATGTGKPPLVAVHIDWKVMGPLLAVVAVAFAGGAVWLVLAGRRRRRAHQPPVGSHPYGPGYPPPPGYGPPRPPGH